MQISQELPQKSDAVQENLSAQLVQSTQQTSWSQEART